MFVTSRESLGIDGEAVEHLQPLDSAHGAAIDLFRARARRVTRDLPLDDEAAIASICRLVDGLPLGIELAAGLCDTLGLGEILTGLEQEAVSDEHPPVRGAALRHDTAAALAQETIHRALAGIG